MTAPRLVLASTSPYRRALLARLRVTFEVRSPTCDEAAIVGATPDDTAMARARAKALAIDGGGGRALVIGSDQVVDLDGVQLGKPGTAARARDQLARLAGRAHRLVTAVAVRDTDSGRISGALDVHTMHMRALSPRMIAAYVAADAPLDCAGSYALERRGVALFERVEADPETADDTAIVGLPMSKLLWLLRGHGFEVIDAPLVADPGD